jgi:hypothetical protein
MSHPGHNETIARPRVGIASLAILAITLGIVAVALLAPLPVSWRSTWRSKLLDLGHIPLFGLFTLVMVRVGRFGLFAAFLCATALAAGSELAQAMVHRSADFNDFLRGSIGSLIAVMLVFACRSPRSVQRALAATSVIILASVWPIADAFPKLWDAWEAYRSFPVLCDFQTRWQVTRWSRERVAVARVMGDDGEHWTGRMDFVPNGAGSAAVVLFPVRRDWSAYRLLCCDFSLADDASDVLISVRDGRRVVGPQKRFDMEESYAAGQHHVRIDLKSLARGDEFAPLDLTRIESFHFAMPHLVGSHTVYMQKVWLE